MLIENVTREIYHPENNISKNNNVVVLFIPVKCLNSNKPKLKESAEMKKQLQTHNPHMKIEWTKVSHMKIHVFDDWLWMKIIFHINCNIKSTMIATTNKTLGLKGRIVFNIM